MDALSEELLSTDPYPTENKMKNGKTTPKRRKTAPKKRIVRKRKQTVRKQTTSVDKQTMESAAITHLTVECLNERRARELEKSKGSQVIDSPKVPICKTFEDLPIPSIMRVTGVIHPSSKEKCRYCIVTLIFIFV